VWERGMDCRILGPRPSVGLQDMLSYVLSVPVARTSEAATALDLKIPNASNKLKQLWQEGYILRREQSANSGGVEYEYVRIA
ncbi:MAG: DNA-binding protein, partial [Chloroflexota bacterium]|nr:DNA-binding protein [Chloroflexota bacterium]